MPSDRTILITNIYNEEYLLPFWLEHHRHIFDHGIIIDYGSTDRSLEICKEICPSWEVRRSRNPNFAAWNADLELMLTESESDGIKMVLTTTEFLFCTKPIKEIFKPYAKSNISFGVKPYAPYTLAKMYPTNLKELFTFALRDGVVFVQQADRGTRQLHNFPNGNYRIGRHYTKNPSVSSDDLHILWVGNFPMNEHTMKRKQNVKTHIPESDRRRGYSYHHFYDEGQMMDVIVKHYKLGVPLQGLNPTLYNMLELYRST